MTRATDIRYRRRGCLGIIAFNALMWAALIWLLVSLCGCTTTKYAPVESVRTEYRDRDVEHVVTDTVHHNRFVFVKGDTVIDWRDRWHRSTEYVHDTCYVELRDTIREPYPVERPLSRWEQTKMDFGGAAIGGLVIALCIAVVWLFKKFRK